jgi:integrase
MPRKSQVPSYKLHKPSGQARVIIGGKHLYLGAFGSPESRQAYARLIAERLAPTLTEPSTPSGILAFPRLTINELLLQYWTFAQTYYVKDGQPTKELTSMREALGHLRAVYENLLATEFSPRKLKAVRQHMIDCGLCRGMVNSRVNRIKRVIKWAVSEELIPSAVYESVRTAPGLKFGRTEARETEPIQPVPDESVDRFLPFVLRQVAAMIELQRLTGMRPGEVVIMRKRDIDLSGAVWIYVPPDHKNRWRGHRRQAPLGPKSQALLTPFLERTAEDCLFVPREAEQERNGARRLQSSPTGKTPIYPSELLRREHAIRARKRRKPKRPKRDRYDVDSYRRAIDYGIRRANTHRGDRPETPHWHPNQLRRRFATDVRRLFGVEAA